MCDINSARKKLKITLMTSTIIKHCFPVVLEFYFCHYFTSHEDFTPTVPVWVFKNPLTLQISDTLSVMRPVWHEALSGVTVIYAAIKVIILIGLSVWCHLRAEGDKHDKRCISWQKTTQMSTMSPCCFNVQTFTGAIN